MEKKDFALMWEARAIAAAVTREFGRHWLAEQIECGKSPDGRIEIQIAVRALQAARGVNSNGDITENSGEISTLPRV